MSKRPNQYYKQIIDVLQRLNKAHPTYNMGRHISTALDGYDDVWGVSDKEMLFALEKYEIELNMDVNHPNGDIDDILKGGMNLNKMFLEDEEE
jgi:hypothetical protein